MLEDTFPDFSSGSNIVGSTYPTSAGAQALATILTIIQWAGIVLVLTGDTAFQTLGIQTPELLRSLLDNKLMLVGVFFIAGQLASKVSASGAFEISLDGELIHSKLETGGVLRVEHLVELLREKGLPTWSDVDAMPVPQQ